MPSSFTRLGAWGSLVVALAAALITIATPQAAFAEGDAWYPPGESPYQYSDKRDARRASPSYLGGADGMAPKQRRSRAGRLANADDESGGRSRTARKRLANLKSTSDDGDSGGYSSKPKVSGGHVSWVASGGCLPGQLKSVIAEVSQYGRVVVSSTGRSHGRNRAVGGASGSYHLSCQAADFRVHGNVASAASFLRNHGSVGGFHHYGGGLFHIDTGPKRTW